MTHAPPEDHAVPRKTRVVVVDDHGMVRAGIRLMLEAAEDLEVVAEASDGAEAVAVCAEVCPDIVLMDVSMPGMDGPEAARRISAQQADVQVLMLTAYRTGAEVLRALDAGAVGYLMKDADPADLVLGIRAVARGESPLDPRAVRAMLQAHTAGPAQELTNREWEVVDLIIRGQSNHQIAAALAISESTVKAHISNIFQRIGVSDRASAAVWAERHHRHAALDQRQGPQSPALSRRSGTQ
jgi:DNA-binding NarL/FixJ family response regulator